MTLEPVVAMEAPLLSNVSEHDVDAQAEPPTSSNGTSLCAEENAATKDQQENSPASLIRDANVRADTARTAATDELDNLDGAESHVKIDAQNPHAEIAALDDVVACVVAGAEDTRNEVTSSRDVSEQLSFGNLFEECSDRKKSTTSSDLSELTPSDDLRSSSDLHLFEGEHRTRGLSLQAENV